MTMAAASGHPELSGASGVGVPGVTVWPSAKHAATTNANASAFRRLVKFCTLLPHETPRHCSTAKNMTTKAAIAVFHSASEGTSTPRYSAMTMATAAVVPHVETQSPQPTTNPAYG